MSRAIPNEKTWRLLIAMGNSMGTSQPSQLRQHPILKEYLKPGSAGLDMEKLWYLFSQWGQCQNRPNWEGH